MRRPSAFLITWLVSACALTPSPRAQAAPAQAAPTLAQALARAEVPRDTVYLVVAAEAVTLPPDAGAAPPPAGATVPQVADAFGRLTQAWETVTAVAPPSMTVVYAPPDTPNPYDGMAAGQVLKFLAATFTKDQWKVFFGPTGLGYSDLQTDAQRSLFLALFPGGHLAVEEDNPVGRNDPATRRDITGDALLQARLRLGYSVSLGLPVAGKPDVHTFGPNFRPADAPARYVMLNGQSFNADYEFGATVRAAVPNAPKDGDLDFDPLTAPVSLAGVRTVDELVARAAAATRRELYADPRYAARTVTLIGTPVPARAKDVLRALALCVCGTFRKVGPAYVLTDDRLGLGTKHLLWKEFEEKARAMLPPDSVLNASVPSPYTIQDIPWNAADPMAFTTAQQRLFWGQWRADPARAGRDIPTLTIPFDRLSPGQQEVARHTQQSNERVHAGTTLDGSVMVQGNLELEATLPSLDGPVALDGRFDDLLPPPARTHAGPAGTPGPMAALPSPVIRPGAPAAGPLRPLVAGFTRRAVRLAPKDAAELGRALTAMQALGFNELWLEVTPGARREEDAAPLALLAQAAKAGPAAGVAVLPDLRLLRWAAGTPAGLWDRDIAGRTAAEAEKAGHYAGTDVRDTVTPFAPEVRDRLDALVRAAAGTPGVSGMVWEDLPPAGFQAFAADGPDTSSLQADPRGFAEAGRLALLRQEHADPVDLYTNYYSDERAHVSVPGFGTGADQTYALSELNRTLYNRWRGLRARTALDLARHLASLLPPAFVAPGAARRPLLLPPANEPSRSPYDRYGSWDDLRGPPPVDAFVPQPGPPGAGGAMQMKSALVYHQVPFFARPGEAASALRQRVAALLGYARSDGSRNVVLDLTQAPDVLDALAAAEPGGQ